MIDLEVVRAALAAGDVTAVLGVADEVCDAGHAEGPEMADLAVEVMAAEDILISQAAAAVFLELAESINRREAAQKAAKEKRDGEQGEGKPVQRAEGEGTATERAATHPDGSPDNVDRGEPVSVQLGK